MNDTEKIRMLQTVYAAALADAVLQYGAEGVLESVERRKEPEQMRQGADMARRMGALTPRDVPEAIAGVFGCAAWTVSGDGEAFAAEAKECLLCAMARRMGAPRPCSLYCINPMKGMIRGLDPSLCLTVKETLWDGGRCLVEVAKQG
jgi:hypothetical protein